MSHKLIITIVVLLAFLSQSLFAYSISCSMMSKPVPKHVVTHKSAMSDHAVHMNHSTHDSHLQQQSAAQQNEVAQKQIMDCCKLDGDCSMGSCSSIGLVALQATSATNQNNHVTILFTFSVINQLTTSLFRPPIFA
jgi:hypothetical protein